MTSIVDILESGFARCADLMGPPGTGTPVGIRLVLGQNRRFCLVLGDNAAGKSLIRVMLTQACRAQQPRVEAIHLSMDGRCAGENRIARLAVYGDEGENSTGHNSARTVRTALSTSRQRKAPHSLLFDEPDLGLSDRWARAVGLALRDFLQNPPDLLAGVVLTTHRRELVRELMPLEPSVLLVGHEWPTSLEDWYAGDRRPLQPLEDLEQEGNDRWRRINRILDARKGR